MKTRTDPKTHLKVVSAEAYELRRLHDAVSIMQLFSDEGIAEASAANKAVQALIAKLSPPPPKILQPFLPGMKTDG